MSEQYPPPPPGYYGPPPGYGRPVAPPGYYASFGQRAVATLWDLVYLLPALAVIFVASFAIVIGAVMVDEGTGGGPVVLVIGIVAMLAGVVWEIWLLIKNVILRQGRTGYTWGKARVGIRCIREVDGQPCGIGSAVARYFLHSIINQACYIDYLWAIWDEKHQTITDKLLNTVVINQPEGASAR